MEKVKANQSLHGLLVDMADCDKDKRYMAASDVTALVLDARLDLDAAVQDQVVRAFLSQLEDSSVDVQGHAAKCLSAFTSRLTEENAASVLAQLARSTLDPNNSVRDIYAACLKGAIGELHQTAATVFAGSVLPDLTGTLATAARRPRGVEEEALELLSEALRHFQDQREIWSRDGSELLVALLEILRAPTVSASVKKKAATALGSFAVVLPGALRQSLFRALLAEVPAPSASSRFFAQALGQVVRQLDAASLAPFVRALTDVCFALIAKNMPASDAAAMAANLDQGLALLADSAPDEPASDAQHELVELCLGMLETFLLLCPEKLAARLERLDALLHVLLSYFPNCYEDADAALNRETDACLDDQDALGFEKDFDFNDEDEDDDSSWRVRKGAVKVLKAEIQAFPEREDVYYGKFLPVLLRAVNGEEAPEEALDCVDEILRATMRTQSSFRERGEESPEAKVPDALERRDGRRAVKRMKVTEKPLARALPSIVATVSRRLSRSTAVSTRLSCLRLLHDLLFAAPSEVSLCLTECGSLVVASLRDPASASAVRLAGLNVVAAALLSGLKSNTFKGLCDSPSICRVSSPSVGTCPGEKSSRGGGPRLGMLTAASLSFCSFLGDAEGTRNARLAAAGEGSELLVHATKAGVAALLSHLVDANLASQVSPQFRVDAQRAPAQRERGMPCGHSPLHSRRGEGGKKTQETLGDSSGEEGADAEDAPGSGCWAAKIDFLLKALPEIVNLTQDGLFEIAGYALLVTGYTVAFLRLVSAAELEGPEAASVAAVLPSLVGRALAALHDSLRRADIDLEVKQASLICVGFVLAAGGGFPETHAQLRTTWPLFMDRLKNEVTREKALEALEVVLLSRFGVDLSSVAGDVLSAVAAALAFQQSRGVRQTCLDILSALVLRYHSCLSQDSLADMLSEVTGQLTPTDLPFVEASLLVILNSLRVQPALAARLIGECVLPRLLLLLRSPLFQGPALTAALHCIFVCLSQFDVVDKERFFQDLGDAHAALSAVEEAEKTPHLPRDERRPGVLHASAKTPSSFSSLSPELLTVLATLAQSRAVVAAAAGDARFSQRTIEQEVEILQEQATCMQPVEGLDLVRLLLALLTTGEIGRLASLVRLPDTTAQEAFEALAALVEGGPAPARRVAARAIGIFVSGNPSRFLLPLISLVQKAHADHDALSLPMSEPTRAGAPGEEASESGAAAEPDARDRDAKGATQRDMKERRKTQHILLFALKEMTAEPGPFLRFLAEEAATPEQDIDMSGDEAGSVAAEAQNASLADLLRPHIHKMLPLFVQLSACAEDSDRCVLSDCLGQLCLLDPPTVIPTVLRLFQTPSADARRTALGCVRSLWASASLLDEKEREAIKGAFLACQSDPDLAVRRDLMAALQVLVGLPRPGGVSRWFSTQELRQVVERLAVEVEVKPELIRQVDLGPFRHTVDDGLPLRKSAYSLLRALLQASSPLCLEEVVPRERLVEFAVNGLTDTNDDVHVLAAGIVSQLASSVSTYLKANRLRVTPRLAALVVSVADAAAAPLASAVTRCLSALQRQRNAFQSASSEGSAATAAEAAERQMDLLRVFVRCMHQLDGAFQFCRGSQAEEESLQSDERGANREEALRSRPGVPAMKKVQNEKGEEYHIVDDSAQLRHSGEEAKPTGEVWMEVLTRELQNPVFLQIWRTARKGGEEGDAFGAVGC
ncbi:HEAT repeat-containing protein [Toxoplasma gondii GT1]|uniref:HEAT repeat-containing protein n=4 Tax=Toxoplasma gondii TaxID=5811 RepID=S7VZF7_TOXGG|nr:HEAT repeat-containing protein [Toxoplasma gondii GT1]